jgi:hypothetical protein
MFRAQGHNVPLTDWAEESANKQPKGNASSHAVPRLKGIEAFDAKYVADAPLQENLPVLSVVGGPAHEVQARRGVTGVFIFTTAGVAFLPETNPDELTPAAALAFELAKDQLPWMDMFLKAGVDAKVTAHSPVPAWMAKARSHPNYFAIPWLHIVQASYEPVGGRTTMVQEDDNGKTHTFAIFQQSDKMPAVLFHERLQVEMQAVVNQKLLVPKINDTMPSVVEKFRSIYGERVAEHANEISGEARHLAVDALMKEGVQTIPDAAAKFMLDVVDHYRRIPQVVASNQQFFNAADSAAKVR